MFDSKIVSVELINFMAIKHGKVIFDDTGIINLKGYNHSGKSAVLRGIAVCLTNYKPRLQADFIHHGMDYFRIIVTFDDKVTIVRDKYKNGQSLYEMYKSGEKVFSTKQGSKLLRVDKVPSVIAQYLGLIETERGCLNLQFRSDPLWLVDTKGSDNYADLSTILRMLEIARANALINADKNKYVSTVSRLEAELQSAKLSLEGYSNLEENLLILLSDRSVSSLSLLGSQDSLLELKELGNSISSVKDIPSVEELEVENLDDIAELNITALGIKRLPKYPEVLEVDTSELSALSSIKSDLSALEELSKDSLYDVLPMLKGISLEELKALTSIMDAVGKLSECNSLLSEISKNEKRYIDGRNKIMDMAKKEGITFVVCKNCGTLMEVKSSG